MSKEARIVLIALLAIALGTITLAQDRTPDDRKSVTIIFKDGRSQSVALDDISRIEFKPTPAVIFKEGRQHNLPSGEISRVEFNTSAKDSPFGRKHFVGKWEVGVDGSVADGYFMITLDENGQAHKTRGSSHGTWVFVDGEARISWEDGWHDIIRRVGEKYEKVAFEPGKTFSDSPSNVARARNTNPEPI